MLVKSMMLFYPFFIPNKDEILILEGLAGLFWIICFVACTEC